MNKNKKIITKRSLVSSVILILGGLFILFMNSGIPDNRSMIYRTVSNATDKFKVLDKDCSRLLYDFQLKIAQEQLDRRKEIVSQAYQDAEKVKEYQGSIRNKLDIIFSSFPEKTPLNAKTMGVIECGDYRIENIVFESRPGLHVPGNLYIPTNKKGPFPGILEACGHSPNGKAYEKYQSAAILLVKNGFVVLVIDTYAQGERPSVSHTQIDIGAMLAGTDLVAYQAWDNIRAIDYLCSRPEVDADKIGVTGNSGGGTQSMYMMAFDERIKAVAPACGLHTRERMFTLGGLADGCHNFSSEGMSMLEFADYFILFAPKPALVLAGERDGGFDIIAASKTVREAKWFYKELGAMDHVDIFTVDEGHGFNKGLREGATWWFKKWLKADTGIVKEPELSIQPDEKLLVTKTGDVLKEFKQAKSIIDINIQQAENFENNRKIFWKSNPKSRCIDMISELINYTDNPDINKIKCTHTGNIIEKDIRIRKLHLVSRDSFPLPALMYIPDNKKTSLPVTVYLNDRGKQKAFDSDSALNVLRKDGRIVIAVDVRGFGETLVNLGEYRKSLHELNDQHQIAQTALYIGYPLMGQRVQDAIDVLDYLYSYPGIKKSDIELIGIGHCGLVALHAAAIDERITSVRIIHSIASWMDIISEPRAKNQFKNVVPGAMKYYDLPDLVTAIAPRPVKVLEPVDAYNRLKK